MTIYCVDDGGDGTQTNATQTAGTLDWSKADTTIANLLAYDAAALTTSGNIIYFGHDTTQTQASALTITGPVTGLPVILISADRTQAVPTYLASTVNQIETTGANAITFDGSFSVFGLRVHSGSYIRFDIDSNESCFLDSLELAPANSGSVDFMETISSTTQGVAIVKNLTVDLTDDTGATGSSVIKCSYMKVRIDGLQFIDPSNRTGGVIDASSGNAHVEVTGADFSGFTSGTLCEIITTTAHPGKVSIYNSKTAATWLPRTTASVPQSGGEVMFSNIGPLDDVTYLSAWDYFGACLSSSSIYRTGGATIEGDATSWLITTTANCAEGAPFYTPWIYGTVSSTGSKTFDCYITNDTADFDDSQVWLEVEYLATADDAKWTLATDQRATVTTTAVAQTDDVTSTWNGTGPAFTYKQKLSVAATIGETGQYRARVAVGVASIAGSRYFYVDPKITVS